MKYTARSMTYIALSTVLIIVGAFITIPLAIVPITLQVLFVLLVGFLMPKEISLRAILLYVFMGLIGLPVFARGGGITYVLQPSFGYLVGFILTIVWIGRVKDKVHPILTGSIALFLIYVIGILYFYFLQRFYFGTTYTLSWLIQSLLIVYLPGDLISMIVVLVLHSKSKNIIKL